MFYDIVGQHTLMLICGAINIIIVVINEKFRRHKADQITGGE